MKRILGRLAIDNSHKKYETSLTDEAKFK